LKKKIFILYGIEKNELFFVYDELCSSKYFIWAFIS